MHRVLCLVVGMLAGCGRIGFAWIGDAGDDDSGPTVDARATVTPPMPITGPGAIAQCPSLVWSGAAWAAAWKDTRDGAAGEVYFARADATGAKLGPDLRVTNDPGNTGCPSLVWTGSQYVVAFDDDRFGNFEMVAQTINAAGTATSAATRVTNGNSISTNAALGWNGSGFDLAWRDVRGVNAEIHYALLSQNFTGTEVQLSATGVFVDQPALVETPSGAAIAWYDDSGTGTQLRFAMIQAGAVQYNVSFGPATTGTVFTGPPTLAWTGSVLAAVWVTEPTSQDREVVFAQVDPSNGALSGLHQLGIAGGAKPSMAAGAGGFGLAQEPGARFVQRDLTGQPVDAPIALGGADPSVGYDGVRFGCAFDKNNAIDLIVITP